MAYIKKDFVLTEAMKRGIQIRDAETKSDAEVEGIHILEPDTLDEILDAVLRAIEHGCNMVMIHSKDTWLF